MLFRSHLAYPSRETWGDGGVDQRIGYLNLTNTGSATVYITDIQWGGSHPAQAIWTYYTDDPVPDNGYSHDYITIQPGGTFQNTIFFSPPSAGSYNGTATIIGTMTSGPTTFSYTGVGNDP